MTPDNTPAGGFPRRAPLPGAAQPTPHPTALPQAPQHQAPQPAPALGGPAQSAPAPGDPVDAQFGYLPPQQQPPSPGWTGPPPRRRTGAMVGGAVALALLAGGAGGAVGYELADRGSTTSATSTGSGADGSVTAVAQAALPSVVTIQIADSSGRAIGTGSGFVIRSDGYIATNAHVASAGGSGERLTVVFSDGSESQGKVVGADSSYDLAVVKVDRTGLRALQFGDSAKLQVGQPVVAVGAPLGLQGSVTSGIVSALNRPVQAGESQSQSSSASDTSYIDAIQTDAAINHGNSGGPLLDLSGKVIGVNAAIASTGQDSGSIGVGFAIPADQAQRTTDQLISSGHATHPVIGIAFDPSYVGDGVKVVSVTAGGPAAKAGLKAGDIITGIDGQKVSSATTFIVALRSRPVGQRVKLVVTSGGESRTVDVTTAGSDN